MTNTRFDSGFLAKAATAVTQQVKINLPASQGVTEAGSHDVQTGIPGKEISFNQAILSHVFFNVGRNGPVFTGDAAVFYNDRFDANKKWYFPKFSLQPPLQNSFLLTCWISGVDKDANSTYSGEVTFVVQKNAPAEVVTEIQNNPAATFTEIPLNNLSFNFTVTLTDNTSLSFPCSLVQDKNNFTLTIKLDQQDGLIRFYKFISNPVNATFCSLKISGSYFGYTQKPGASTSPIYSQALFKGDLQSFGAGATAFFPGRAARGRFVCR